MNIEENISDLDRINSLFSVYVEKCEKEFVEPMSISDWIQENRVGLLELGIGY